MPRPIILSVGHIGGCLISSFQLTLSDFGEVSSYLRSQLCNITHASKPDDETHNYFSQISEAVVDSAISTLHHYPA